MTYWARRVRLLSRAMASVAGAALLIAGGWAYHVTGNDLADGQIWTDRFSRTLLGVLLILAGAFFTISWNLSAARYYLRVEDARNRPTGRGRLNLRARPVAGRPRTSLALAGMALVAGSGVNTDVDLRVAPLGETHGLALTEWQLVALGPPGEIHEYPVDPHVVASGVLRLDGRGHYSAEFCGGEWGTARVRGNQLRLKRTAELAPGCYGSDDYTYEAVMARTLSWAIKDGRLTLANSKGSLVYRERDSIYPHQSARTVLAGEKNGWQYRVAVEPTTQSRHTTRGWFEYRRGPGHSWSFNPLYAAATPEQTVFRHPPGPPVVTGFAPLHGAYVEYVAETGATPLRLPVTTIAPKHRWKAFAGEVPSSSPTSTIKAVDTNGRTIMTCTVTYSGTDRDDFGCSL